MSEDAEEKPTIVIDGKVLTEQLDERMIHDVVNGFYDEIRKDTPARAGIQRRHRPV
jgi:hemoglobin